MEDEFKDTWAVILGASGGLGLASAKKLAAHGMNLCLVHRDRKSNLSEFASEVKKLKEHGVEVFPFNQDVLKAETLENVSSVLPKKSVRLLLHSIARGSVKPMLGTENNTLTNEDLRITVDAMALSWFNWTQAFVHSGLFQDNARNIAFTSEGNTKALPNYGAVSVAKAALEALMRQMAVEFAPVGVRTNCIQAGVTKTKSFGMIPGNEKIAAYTLQRNPFQQLTQPENVGDAVYLLCKDEADWINGTILKVDGGESLR